MFQPTDLSARALFPQVTKCYKVKFGLVVFAIGVAGVAGLSFAVPGSRLDARVERPYPPTMTSVRTWWLWRTERGGSLRAR